MILLILRASYGTLGLLGLVKNKIKMETAYFMLDGKCVFDCHFCSHAKSSNTENKFLSRIIWKEISVNELQKLANIKELKRVCLQVVSYPGYREDLLNVLEYIKNFKVSISVRALNFNEVKMYFDKGVDSVGISVDVVNPELFRKIRGGDYFKTISLIKESSERYPWKITTHVIVGMGETDKELVEFFYEMKKYKVNVALFALTPIEGTKFENSMPPSKERYRKIQLARYLIFEKDVPFKVFNFNNTGKLENIIYEYSEGLGKAFLTSGCTFCTRPFYNENPGDEPFNYHIYFKNLESEAKRIIGS